MKLIPTKHDEIPLLKSFEDNIDTSSFIIPYSLEKHLEEFSKENIIYLSIFNNHEIIGFFILAKDLDDTSLEFRRIVINQKSKGLGQKAILAMHRYCKEILKLNRIWLDVFEHNARGIHIYEKLGYKLFDTSIYQGKKLLLYELNLQIDIQ